MANPLTEALDNYLYALVRCGADDDPQECYHAEAQALRVMRANRIAACQHRGYVWQDKGPIGLLFTIIQHADDIEFPEDDPTSDTALADAMSAVRKIHDRLALQEDALREALFAMAPFDDESEPGQQAVS